MLGVRRVSRRRLRFTQNENCAVYSLATGRACRGQPQGHGQQHSVPGDGRGREGQVRPSRHAHGHGRRGDRAVPTLPALRPGTPRLAGPGPLPAVGRPRLDAALRAALPLRLREDDAGAASELPPARQPHGRPSRARARRRHRDHHRPPRPGPWQLGRLRPGRAPPERQLRRRAGGPLDLRAVRRRLPDGRHQPRGRLPRRSPEAGTPHRPLRRQPHLDRRPDLADRLGRPGRALRGLRLACPVGRRARSRGGLGGHRGGPGGPPALADRLPHGDRLRRAHQGGQREDPRRPPRRRGDRRRAREARLALSALRGAGGDARRLARPRRQGRRPLGRLGREARRPAGEDAPRVRAPPARRPARGLGAGAFGTEGQGRRRAARRRHPGVLPEGPRRAQARDPRGWWAARPI